MWSKDNSRSHSEVAHLIIQPMSPPSINIFNLRVSEVQPLSHHLPDNTHTALKGCIIKKPLLGCIPSYGLQNPIIDENIKPSCGDIIQLDYILKQGGRHNHRGLQILIPSKLNVDQWASYLSA